MTRVPLYVSDGDIGRAWKEYNGSLVKAVRFEPIQHTGYRKATVWFSDLVGQLPHPYYSAEQTTSIFSNNYKKKFLPGAEKLGNILGFLEPCSTTEEPPGDFSFIVAHQLQDIVSKQAEQIQRLENRLEEMERRIHEGTELYLDINQSSMAAFKRMKTRIRSQNTYSKCLEANIAALQAKQAEDMISYLQEKEQWKQKIDALTEWCSQPLWKRTSAFVFPKELEDGFVSDCNHLFLA